MVANMSSATRLIFPAQGAASASSMTSLWELPAATPECRTPRSGAVLTNLAQQVRQAPAPVAVWQGRKGLPGRSPVSRRTLTVFKIMKM